MKMKVGILCSGVALGVYIPGIYINRNLNEKGISSKVFVLENLLPPQKISMVHKNKTAFHNNFSLALTGQRMARDILPATDRDKMKIMFEQWHNEGISYFIVLSGFWLSIIEEYKKVYSDTKIVAECLHIDATISASWRKAKTDAEYCVNSWLFRYEEKRVVAGLDYTMETPVPFSQRSDRVLVHGGGWGMGTYQNKIPQLEKAGLSMDIIAYQLSEIWESNLHRFYMTDPDWSPWQQNAKGEHEFPPFAQVTSGKKMVFHHSDKYHKILELSRNVKAIVSKPGGATLLDSIAAATPIILLEPFGQHEEKNAQLWEYLGFGISYEAFEKSNFDLHILEKLHFNLVDARNKVPSYIESFIEKTRGNFDAT